MLRQSRYTRPDGDTHAVSTVLRNASNGAKRAALCWWPTKRTSTRPAFRIRSRIVKLVESCHTCLCDSATTHGVTERFTASRSFCSHKYWSLMLVAEPVYDHSSDDTTT